MSKFTLKKDINLLLSYNRKPINLEKKKSQSGKVLFLVVFALAMLAVYGYFIYSKINLENEIADIKSYMADEENQSATLKSQNAFNELTANTDLYYQLETASKGNLSFDSKTTFEKINSSLSTDTALSGISYSSADKCITIEIKSKNVFDINALVKRLHETKIFSSVNYSGYNYTATDKVYTVRITMFLVERSAENE